MIKIKVQVNAIDHGEKFILQQLKELGDGAFITTGIQHEDFNKTQTLRGRSRGETPVGEYAAIQEFGSKDGKTPARPFMQKTVDMNIVTFMAQTTASLRSMYNGNLTLDALLKRQASRQQKVMRKTIKTWTTPGIAPGTVRSKERLNRRTEPLQETRTMLNNIKSKIKKEGGPLNFGMRKLMQVSATRVVVKGRVTSI